MKQNSTNLLDRRAMLGLTATALAGSLTACSGSSRAATQAGLPGRQRFQDKVVIITGAPLCLHCEQARTCRTRPVRRSGLCIQGNSGEHPYTGHNGHSPCETSGPHGKRSRYGLGSRRPGVCKAPYPNGQNGNAGRNRCLCPRAGLRRFPLHDWRANGDRRREDSSCELRSTDCRASDPLVDSARKSTRKRRNKERLHPGVEPGNTFRGVTGGRRVKNGFIC